MLLVYGPQTLGMASKKSFSTNLSMACRVVLCPDPPFPLVSSTEISGADTDFGTFFVGGINLPLVVAVMFSEDWTHCAMAWKNG